MSRPKRVVTIGPLSPNGPGKHYIPEREHFDVPSRVTNASSVQPYTGTAWNLRPGAEAHKQFKSKGVQC